ncbi:MAG: hypothetical protein HWD92_04900 [Flavobacteriia bacterium]|nr:hypothetical protein [Flavobacteriia bacterium]
MFTSHFKSASESIPNQYARLLQDKEERTLLKAGDDIYPIDHIPPGGLSLSTGQYVFTKDLEFTPPFGDMTAIKIVGNGVSLDMGGFKLTATGSNKTTTFGIQVMAGEHTVIENVTVKNGHIHNFGVNGLSAIRTNQLVVDNVQVHELTYPIFDIVPTAFFLDQANSFEVYNCKVIKMDVIAMTASAFLVANSAMGILYNNHVDGFKNSDGVAGAFVLDSCSFIRTLECTAKNLQTVSQGSPLSTIGHTCIGFMPTSSNNLVYSNCVADTLLGCCDDCHGMSLFSVNNVSVDNFRAYRVYDGLGSQKTGAKATGVEVYGSNITVTNSHAEDISSIDPQDLQATGFSACGANITFSNCSAHKVLTSGPDAPGKDYEFGTGFGWAPDPRPQFVKPAVDITYENCTATQCQIGFDTWNHQNSNWKENSFESCETPIKIQPYGTVRVYRMNFCSELPKSKPGDPFKNFPIYNCAMDNTVD